MNRNEFDDIRPYTDAEAAEALGRIARHPLLPLISKYLFPDRPASALRRMLSGVQSVAQFQSGVMFSVVQAILAKTSAGFTCGGMEHLKALEGKCFLAVSNHRDIVLDPALVQYALYSAGLPCTEICVGSNLITARLTEDIMRSNRMIKVIRGIPARELYLSSQRLSAFIRGQIVSGTASVWIAQREGRTKDGRDATEQGLLKMFDMSGGGTFGENFRELNIVPLSISYEYESCDALKAREVLLRRRGPYVKKKNEDLRSILTGIRQPKGHIHLEIGAPLTAEEIAAAAQEKKNDRYQALCRILDRRILGGYRLWKTHYMAHDLLHGKTEFLDAGRYDAADLAAFERYVAAKVARTGRRADRQELRRIFLEIYAGPVEALVTQFILC